jgi:hypothetical protein
MKWKPNQIKREKEKKIKDKIENKINGIISKWKK